jgi:hypothetical protein
LFLGDIHFIFIDNKDQMSSTEEKKTRLFLTLMETILPSQSARVAVTFYGSCQMTALAHMFASSHEIHCITNWTYILSGEELPAFLWESDVLVHQVYHGTGVNAPYSTEAVLEQLLHKKPWIITVSVPFMLFHGYFPHYKPHDPRDVITAEYPYGKFPCVPPPDIIITEDDVRDRAEVALDGLRRHDAECDVKIAPFVEENWRHRRLFHSPQHPSDEILKHVAQQIADRLGWTVEYVGKSKGMLEDHLPPVLPHVAEILALEFSTDICSWFNGPPVTLQRFEEERKRFTDAGPL